ncbi:hypothetical protein IPG41_05065 [Candidatus Peregrinibacteria bacterium]|nr:MAG: hypothetical protein IPG41_05065 [Candidatus Peregrinibacteria bacterium]
MRGQLEKLGFNPKEVEVYLALLEFGTQPASVIAKKTKIPRPTVLFLFENLLKKAYIRKTQRSRTQYFYADPADLQTAKTLELEKAKGALEEAIPLLKEFKNPFTSQPKVTFFEGLDGCRRAYSLLLESTTEVLEFAPHDDLRKMGDDFMEAFMTERARRKILIKPICPRNKTHIHYKKLDKKHHRKIKMFDPKKGTIYSSITVFEDKVLLLNLYQDAFAILIQNKQVAETLKTLHNMIWAAL